MNINLLNLRSKILVLAHQQIQELHVIENLNVYTAVYKTISSNSRRGRKGRYSLIVLNSRENTISLETYGANQFETAARTYLELETKHFEDTQINVVLVNSGDLRKLELSYPNYFMDTKTLVQCLSLIVMDKFF